MMSSRKICVSKELLQASKGLLILGVVVSQVKVQKVNEQLWNMLQEVGNSQKKYDVNKLDKIKEIQELRNTYKSLGLKVSEYKGSNEALLRRILADKGLYQINTVVDINNYISVESLRSVGSYDLGKLTGDIEFRKGKADEKYVGTTNRSVALKNLPVLCDQTGPFGSPTSDSSRALIRDTTTDVMTVIFSFDGQDKLEEQLLTTSNFLKTYADAQNVQSYLVRDHPVELMSQTEKACNLLEALHLFTEHREIIKDCQTVKDNEAETITIKFTNDLSGDYHGDMQQLMAVEYVVNLLKSQGMIKNETTKVESEFAYNGVPLNYKTQEFGEIRNTNSLPLRLKLYQDHVDLVFPTTGTNIDEAYKLITSALKGDSYPQTGKKSGQVNITMLSPKSVNMLELAKDHKEQLLGYKVIDKGVKKVAFGFKKALSGDHHVDMQNILALEYVVNFLKSQGLIKNESTLVESDKTYNGVTFDYKIDEYGQIKESGLKNIPTLSLKLTDDHFELAFTGAEADEHFDAIIGLLSDTFEQ